MPTDCHSMLQIMPPDVLLHKSAKATMSERHYQNSCTLGKEDIRNTESKPEINRGPCVHIKVDKVIQATNSFMWFSWASNKAFHSALSTCQSLPR